MRCAEPPRGFIEWLNDTTTFDTASSGVSGPLTRMYMRVPVRRSKLTMAPAELVLALTFDASTAPAWSPGVASAGILMVIGMVACLPGGTLTDCWATVAQVPASVGALSPASRANWPLASSNASVA